MSEPARQLRLPDPGMPPVSVPLPSPPAGGHLSAVPEPGPGTAAAAPVPQAAAAAPRAAKSTASGSNTRQRGKVISVRLLPDEEAALRAKAAPTGLSLGSYIRSAIAGSPGPRARRSPPLNAQLLGQAVAELNKAGSNLNQIARVINTAGLFDPRMTDEVLRDVRAAVADIRAAVGRADRG